VKAEKKGRNCLLSSTVLQVLRHYGCGIGEVQFVRPAFMQWSTSWSAWIDMFGTG